MPNPYFQFKQFTIQQQLCAMKVCTDACLFGAIVANEIENKNYTTALDIGTGTGLLSLMLAQKNKQLTINAIEIDSDAFVQAKENFNNSPFSNQLKIEQINFLDYQANQKFDVIICNPPFFKNDLPSNNQKNNLAKHSTTLELQELLQHSQPLLTSSGIMAVLIPYSRSIYFEQCCNTSKLFIAKKIVVKQTTAHAYFRSIYFLSQTQSQTNELSMSIKDEEDNYTNQFIGLLKDYYLYL